MFAIEQEKKKNLQHWNAVCCEILSYFNKNTSLATQECPDWMTLPSHELQPMSAFLKPSLLTISTHGNYIYS